MRLIHNGLLIPVFEPMMRRIKASAEHWARLKDKMKKITDARTDYEWTC